MSNSKQEQIEEIVALINSEAETLDGCRVRYGAEWANLHGPVLAALSLQEIGAEHGERVGKAGFDKEALWAKLQPRLGQSGAGSADSGGPELLIIGGGAADSGGPDLADSVKIVSFEDAPAVRRARRSVWPRPWIARIAATLIIFMVLSSGFVGVVQASEPGDLLYGTKLEFDRVGVTLASSPDDKAAAQLAFANKRLDEIERAISRGRYNNIEPALSSYQAAVNQSVGSNPTGRSLPEIEHQQQVLSNLQQTPALPGWLQNRLVEVIVNNQSQLQKIGPVPTPVPNFTPLPQVAPLPTATTPVVDPTPTVVAPAKPTTIPTVTPVPVTVGALPPTPAAGEPKRSDPSPLPTSPATTVAPQPTTATPPANATPKVQQPQSPGAGVGLPPGFTPPAEPPTVVPPNITPPNGTPGATVPPRGTPPAGATPPNGSPAPTTPVQPPGVQPPTCGAIPPPPGVQLPPCGAIPNPPVVTPPAITPPAITPPAITPPAITPPSVPPGGSTPPPPGGSTPPPPPPGGGGGPPPPPGNTTRTR